MERPVESCCLYVAPSPGVHGEMSAGHPGAALSAALENILWVSVHALVFVLVLVGLGPVFQQEGGKWLF